MSGYHFSFCFASKKIGLCLQMWLGFPFCKSSSEHPISYWHWSNSIYISTDTFIHCVTVESATKRTLITDQPQNGPWLLILLWAINFSTFMVILNHFWPLGGLLGAPSNLWGPPRASMSSLTSKDTLPPESGAKKTDLDCWFCFGFFDFSYFYGHF